MEIQFIFYNYFRNFMLFITSFSQIKELVDIKK